MDFLGVLGPYQHMVEGCATKDFRKIRSAVFNDSGMIKNLIDKLTISTDYLVMQAKAGADVLMIFDSWGGLLNSEKLSRFFS